MEELCERIDALLVEHLELVMAYQSRCERVALHLNQGFLQLTQAKFIMGQRRLCSSQYDRRMQASLTVRVSGRSSEPADGDSQSGGTSTDGEASTAEPVQFQLQRLPFEVPVAADAGEPATAIEIHSPTTTTATRHRLDSTQQTSNSISNSSGHQIEMYSTAERRDYGTQSSAAMAALQQLNYFTSESGPSMAMGDAPQQQQPQQHKESFRMTRMRTWSQVGRRDPVAWFGVLVPGALRAAQTHFQQNMTDIVHLASLRASILAHEQRLSELLAQKRALQQRLSTASTLVELTGTVENENENEKNGKTAACAGNEDTLNEVPNGLPAPDGGTAAQLVNGTS